MTGSPIAILQVQLARGGTDEHPLTRSVVNLGRAPDNDVILDDPQVSGHHARLSFVGGTAGLMDLGSLNGTCINGQRIPPRTAVPIQPGQVFQIHDFNFTLRLPDQGTLPPVGERVKLRPASGPGLAAYVEGKLFKFPFDKAVMSLGRAPENDIVIPSNLVSRQHARIEWQGTQYVMIDIGGRNGLTVGQQRVPQHVLSDGDVIYIGGRDVALQYRASLGFVAVAAEPPAPKTMALDLRGRETITIGREPGNQIVLDRPQVSRYHALIERMGTRYRIKDLKSSNGVFVGGKRIEKEAWLKEGDEIHIGGAKLVLREDGIQQFTEEGLRLDAMRLNKWVSKEKNLLQDISLAIYPQEFVALVGMSGSGKSTLMDAINGFRPATHGRVAVNGVDLYHNFDLFRNEMGYVPQKDIVHQELTVFSALDYAAQLRMPADTSVQERHQRILEVLRDLDLSERKDLPILKLSGGQLKRVSIGVELLTKPRLFFLDEPTSGLDPGTEFEMMKLLRKLADQGRTIMLITHATKNVMMCDKVIFLARGGYMAYYGPPEEALPYFDQFRKPQERQQKDIEFDDIYMILNDEKRGTGKDWGERYRGSQQYRENVVERLQERPPTADDRPQQAAVRGPSPTTRQQTGLVRQFSILSARNLKIMAQDRFGLALMLALAPMIGLMDFIWGTSLFDLARGDAAKIITMFFMAGLISILVGAMASVREIVKEVDIYRRERAINLKLTSYILSKVWVGATLSLYQAVVLLFFKWLLVLRTSPLDPGDYGLMFGTMFLGTLSGYLIGLCISAAAPNQNVALLLVVVVLVPQFLFAGALLPLGLIPGGEIISAATSTRWAFEAMVTTSGIGRDIVNDPCWQTIEREHKQPGDLTDKQKEDLGCKCMGARIFDGCQFPGIRNPDFYTADARTALAAARPVEPPKPTAYPSLTPYPTRTPLPTPADPRQMQKYMDDSKKQGQEYQDQRVQQGQDYEKLRSQQGDEYASAMKRYGDERESWQRDREKAISAAENNIKVIIADPLASRYHARLVRDGERWGLADLGSTNGTRVNEQAIGTAMLSHNDTISVGNWRLVFVAASEGPAQGDKTVEITLSEISGPRLILYTGTATREVVLTGTLLTLGRNPDCDIVLDHEKVSRRHAEIHREGETFVIIDLSSTNGTWMNEQRIERHTLQDRDTVEIGSVRLVFRAGHARPLPGRGAGEPGSRGASEGSPLPPGPPAPRPGRRRHPVIFIPGMSGSELWRGDKLIWPNPIGLVAEMDAMALPKGQDMEARGLVKQIVVIPGLFRLEVYGRCLDYLIEKLGYKRGRDLIELPWDWRLDFRLASQKLAEAVRAWKQKYDRGAEKFVLLAHSMGGLVARYYIERLGGGEHVARLIVMGTPHLGTPKSFLSLFSGADSLPFDIMKDKSRQIALSFPAVYQGLPAYPAVFDASGRPIDILSD